MGRAVVDRLLIQGWQGADAFALNVVKSNMLEWGIGLSWKYATGSGFELPVMPVRRKVPEQFLYCMGIPWVQKHGSALSLASQTALLDAATLPAVRRGS